MDFLAAFRRVCREYSSSRKDVQATVLAMSVFCAHGSGCFVDYTLINERSNSLWSGGEGKGVSGVSTGPPCAPVARVVITVLRATKQAAYRLQSWYIGVTGAADGCVLGVLSSPVYTSREYIISVGAAKSTRVARTFAVRVSTPNAYEYN